jgi:hypothetical protein
MGSKSSKKLRMHTITIKNIFKISVNRNVYVSKFNFEFRPKVGMIIMINNIKCKIIGIAEKKIPNTEIILLNKKQNQWDLILENMSSEQLECNKEYFFSAGW